MENDHQSFIYLKGYNNIIKHKNAIILFSLEGIHDMQVKK